MTLGPGPHVIATEYSITTQGEVQLKAVAEVTFEASTSITLDSGFSVESGGTFTANIDLMDCNAATE